MTNINNVEPKKVTDIVYDLDKKVNLIIELLRVTDLNQKILINKLKETVERLDKISSINTSSNNFQVTNNNFKIEATDTQSLKTNKDLNIQSENIPKGFRRNSRPETYSGDNEYVKNIASPTEEISSIKKSELNHKQENNQKDINTPINKNNDDLMGTEIKIENKELSSHPNIVGNILVQQRVVNKNGKSVFLADVEIINLENNTESVKTRTNAAGKWSSALAPGNYRVTLKKMDAATKEKIEMSQDIIVDGRINPLDIPMVIIK